MNVEIETRLSGLAEEISKYKNVEIRLYVEALGSFVAVTKTALFQAVEFRSPRVNTVCFVDYRPDWFGSERGVVYVTFSSVSS